MGSVRLLLSSSSSASSRLTAGLQKDKKAPSRAEPKKPGKGKRRKSQNDKASRTFIESEMPDDEKEDDRVSEAPQKTVTASVRNTWAHNVLSSNPKRLAKQFGSAKK